MKNWKAVINSHYRAAGDPRFTQFPSSLLFDFYRFGWNSGDFFFWRVYSYYGGYTQRPKEIAVKAPGFVDINTDEEVIYNNFCLLATYRAKSRKYACLMLWGII